MRMRISGKPRAAHCIGCGVTFEKMHLKIHHRRSERCGGRFLPADERELVEAARKHYEKYLAFWTSNQYSISGPEQENVMKYHFAQHEAILARFYELRKLRLDKVRDEQAA